MKVNPIFTRRSESILKPSPYKPWPERSLIHNPFISSNKSSEILKPSGELSKEQQRFVKNWYDLFAFEATESVEEVANNSKPAAQDSVKGTQSVEQNQTKSESEEDKQFEVPEKESQADSPASSVSTQSQTDPNLVTPPANNQSPSDSTIAVHSTPPVNTMLDTPISTNQGSPTSSQPSVSSPSVPPPIEAKNPDQLLSGIRKGANKLKNVLSPAPKSSSAPVPSSPTATTVKQPLSKTTDDDDDTIEADESSVNDENEDEKKNDQTGTILLDEEVKHVKDIKDLSIDEINKTDFRLLINSIIDQLPKLYEKHPIPKGVKVKPYVVYLKSDDSGISKTVSNYTDDRPGRVSNDIKNGIVFGKSSNGAYFSMIMPADTSSPIFKERMKVIDSYISSIGPKYPQSSAKTPKSSAKTPKSKK